MKVSVEDAALVCRDHVFNVDEGVLPTSLLQQLKSLHNQVSQIQSLTLAVFDLVPNTRIVVSEDVEDRKDLTVIGN